MTKEEKQRLDAELVALNEDVKIAIAKRREWMDAHMADYAEYAIGTELVWMQSDIGLGTTAGAPFGTVTKHYRYWADRDPRYDTSMDVHYEVRMPHSVNCFDNTSRLASPYLVSSREKYAERLRSELRRAESDGVPA